MKRRLFFLLLTVCQVFTTAAQKKDTKWIDNAGKAIVTVETTSKEGMTKTGTGFIISENGEAIASYDLFKKAEKAVAITSSGDRLPVTHILGANEIYGVIRIKVTVPKKTAFLTVANVSPAMNTVVYLPPSKEDTNISQGAITEITKMSGGYDYFKIEMPLPQSQTGFPLLTETGEVFALAQADALGKGNTYGLSVAFVRSLQTTASDMFNKTYTEIGIQKAWASDIDDARIALMIYSSQQDVASYLKTINDFILTFPQDVDGYINRASHYAYKRKELASTNNEQLQLLDKAWSDLETAAKLSQNKGDGFYKKARLVFGVVAGDSLPSYKNWNMKTVDDNLQKAIKEANLPVYRQLEGEVAFFKEDYEKAYASLSFVNQSSESSGISFYLAAKSKQQLDETNLLEITALIDSAVAKSPPNEAAAYLLENIDLKLQIGLYEQVINDYNKYLVFTNGNVTDAFYYYRHQAKFRTGDLEGALKDIETAIMMDKTNAVYYAEKASVCLRLNDISKAQESVEKALELDDEFASAYRILGVCLVRQEKQSEACTHFNKAKELGDPVVDRLIRDNCSE